MSRPSAPIAPARLARLRRLSYWLDNAISIPGTPIRFGLDPIIGLLPGGGDTAGMLLSAFVVLEAARLGASKTVLSNMAFNILLETLVGTVPIAGDLFDATWKSNARNMRLLEEHLQVSQLDDPGLTKSERPANHGFALLLIGGLFVVFIGCLAGSVLLLRWIFQQLGW